jgi:hypothetical protein
MVAGVKAVEAEVINAAPSGRPNRLRRTRLPTAHA